MKMLSDYPPYQNYYHFVGSTKYRKFLFEDETIRNRLQIIICDILEKKGIKIEAVTVAYNHVHVLLQTELNPSDVAQVLFGVSSRRLRKEFPQLVEKARKGLWGGLSCEAIKDEIHLKNCISYIRRHLPDNTKMDDPEI